jgi:hypothetical protein
MGHEYLARALVELMQIGKTPSGPDRLLHHLPETFNEIEPDLLVSNIPAG